MSDTEPSPAPEGGDAIACPKCARCDVCGGAGFLPEYEAMRWALEHGDEGGKADGAD